MSSLPRFLFILCLALSAAPLCQAQDYPQRTIKLVSPYAPGAGIDVITRVFADGFTRRWKHPMIVENRPGAAGVVGVDAVVRSAPNGYTLLFAADAPITTTPHLLKNKPYDPLKDLVPISLLARVHLFVTVNPAVAASTLPELVALAKRKPNGLTYATIGIGSPPHVLFESLNAETGIQILHIPYNGAIAANTAVVTGQVDMTALGASMLPMILAGKLKALAVCAPNRLQVLPNIATCKEAGFKDPGGWIGMFAPAGTPSAIISMIQATAVEILNSPDFVARGYDPNAYTKAGSTSAEFARFLEEDIEYRARLIRTAGIVPE